MDLIATLIVMAIAVGVFFIASFQANRPANPLKPRMAPWRVIIVLAGAVAIFMLVHLVNLFGFATGQPRQY